MTLKDPVRVCLVGTAARSGYLYGPLLKALPEEVSLVSVWGRSEGSARRLGESLGVPWYTDLERLIQETAPQVGVVSVSYGANGVVGLDGCRARASCASGNPYRSQAERSRRDHLRGQ